MVRRYTERRWTDPDVDAALLSDEVVVHHARRNETRNAAEADAPSQPEIAQMQEHLTALQAQQAEATALGESGAMIAQLQQLARLKESGMLTDDEFAAAKARLLAG